MSERREVLRRRVYLGARIVHRHLRSDTACLLRNLSGRGARISVCATIPLPDRFDLFVDSHATARPVEAIWRSGDELGVRFLGAMSQPRDPGPARTGPQTPGGDPSPPGMHRTEGECPARPVGALLH